jgi:hypothetical protein
MHARLNLKTIKIYVIKLTGNFKTYFGIDATYEMRTTEHCEICISNDNQTIGEEGFYLK